MVDTVSASVQVVVYCYIVAPEEGGEQRFDHVACYALVLPNMLVYLCG